jgi:hypothetical protein
MAISRNLPVLASKSIFLSPWNKKLKEGVSELIF